MLHAVLTGDIVNSTKLEPKKEKKLMKLFYQILEPYKFEFYRGDSFQAYIREPKEALKIVLQCRTAAISVTGTEEATGSDVRISIGIGSIAAPIRKLATAKGEAFILSGRSFDVMSKDDSRLTIMVGGKNKQFLDLGMELVANYIDSIYRGMTAKQAEVILELLVGNTQQEAAKKLKKSKSTISQLVSSAKWVEIEKVMGIYEQIINSIK
ncbi:MAG: hypothetical protein K2Q21_14295 [Chitinophagaceae bacterium]|nr:hypothetical protein [Chitinophagaceae bacterium]